jgi:hypothetical protein
MLFYSLTSSSSTKNASGVQPGPVSIKPSLPSLLHFCNKLESLTLARITTQV